MPCDYAADPASIFHSDRMLCGMRVASRLPLPDLLPWNGDDRAPDLHIELGNVPASLDSPVVDRPLLQVSENGLCRYAIPGVAAWLISADGRHVTIAPAPSADAAEIRAFLYGTVFAVVCLRRGLLPLHASCVRIGDAAVAFAGHSGAGKSTLAAMLMKQGYSLLADDVTVIDMTGTPLVLPAFPRVKLWQDSMARLGFSSNGLEQARPGLEKYHVPADPHFCTTPLPLAGLVMLESQPIAPGTPRPLTPVERLKCMGNVLYRPQLISWLMSDSGYMDFSFGLLAKINRFMTVRRPASQDDLDAIVSAFRGAS